MSKEYFGQAVVFEKCLVCGGAMANGPDTPDQTVLKERIEHMKQHGFDFSYLLKEQKKP